MTTTSTTLSELTVGSRRSPLARAQVIEVQKEINQHYPNLTFDCFFIDTSGDVDQSTSIRTLEKTNFFTKEIDTLLLTGECRIAIHSAKDLPNPLSEGLSIVALTSGLDPSDVVVLKPGISLATLPPTPTIATSSIRREEAARKVIPDATFIDLRGTIDQRLMLLQTGPAHGIVVAEAALIRLGLTHLNRIKLPGPTAELQGKLAVIARTDDAGMHALFACIDSRREK